MGCKIIAVGNQKGGVGKTTLLLNIATSLASMGSKVLMIDLDPQASLTESCGFEPQDMVRNVTDLFSGSKEDACDSVYNTDLVGENILHIIPSTPLLSTIELRLFQATCRETKLKKALTYFKSGYDYILIDCAPTLSLLTINALTSATHLLIPAGCSRLDHYALDLYLSTIQDIKEELNPNLTLLGVVASMYDSRANEDKLILSDLKDNPTLKVLGILPRTTQAKKYLHLGIPTILGNPKCKLSIEYIRVAENIKSILESEA